MPAPRRIVKLTLQLNRQVWHRGVWCIEHSHRHAKEAEAAFGALASYPVPGISSGSRNSISVRHDSGLVLYWNISAPVLAGKKTKY